MAGEKRGAGTSSGPLRAISPTSAAPMTPATLAATTTGPQSTPAYAPRARNRKGSATPTVKAPFTTPIARPRSRRNQPAPIFIATGYTAASAAPVRNRNGIAEPGSVASNPNPRLAIAAMIAPAANSRGAGMTSGAPITARPIAPTANPSWTITVRNGRSSSPTVHSSRRIGATAAAANDGDMAR